MSRTRGGAVADVVIRARARGSRCRHPGSPRPCAWKQNGGDLFPALAAALGIPPTHERVRRHARGRDPTSVDGAARGLGMLGAAGAVAPSAAGPRCARHCGCGALLQLGFVAATRAHSASLATATPLSVPRTDINIASLCAPTRRAFVGAILVAILSSGGLRPASAGVQRLLRVRPARATGEDGCWALAC